VLKLALLTLTQAGNDEIDFRDRTSNAWAELYLQRVDAEIEPIFFDHLFACAEQGAEAERAWVERLQRIATAIFEDAVQALPTAGARRLKAVAVAEQRLNGAFRKTFAGYLSHTEAEHGG
jgi:hypothetical protein